MRKWESESAVHPELKFICHRSENGFYPFLISHKTLMNICRLCQVILCLFLAQRSKGTRRRVHLCEHVIQHKTLKPQILHLFSKSANCSAQTVPQSITLLQDEDIYKNKILFISVSNSFVSAVLRLRPSSRKESALLKAVSEGSV